MNLGFDNINCPICKAKAKFELKKDNCNYFKCQICNFLFHRSHFGNTNLNKKVNSSYNREYWNCEQTEAKRREEEDALNRAFELIYLSTIPVKRILDFGCGFGITVEKIKEHLGIEAVGVDPFGQFEENEFLHKKYLTDVVNNYGKEYFDAIYSIEVFEHLEDPASIMKELDYFLKPGGKILINTMTVEAIKEYDHNLSYIDPIVRGHISIWSIKSFEQLGKMFGYKVTFMNARKYVIILTKGENVKIAPVLENIELFRKIGSWYPQLMQEYNRLLHVEGDFNYFTQRIFRYKLLRKLILRLLK